MDRALSVQRPVVVAHIRALRRSHPNASPAQLVRILERRYLTAITTGGAAVGATAMVPGFGTGLTLTLAGAETAGFLETTALFAQSVAEVHGITVDDPVRARALVMTLMLGKAGTDLVRQFTGQAFRGGPPRKVFWGEMVTSKVPQAVMGPVADELRRRFLKHFVKNQGTSLVGKAMPFGIGAVIGGAGNNFAGRQVVTAARSAFGPPPVWLPLELEPRERKALPTIRQLRERLPSPRKAGRRDAEDPTL
ncbi:hypothetical protein D9V29_09740 [Mycetocola manganoxydans]|uniref:Di-and tripeptidase n=1 Tax=Mycetocola manganoxydans TaxID=699879 RepID=A0A3L6ZSK1_9MICO|nr:hypothetical protein D9V29_09740 [Mycetocola manganoxydans]